MPPEGLPLPADLEGRLELAGTRARRARGHGGALSARAAHDLREAITAGAVTGAAAAGAGAPEAAAGPPGAAPLHVERRRWTRATTPSYAVTQADLPPAPAGMLMPSAIASPISRPQVRRARWSGGRVRPLPLVAMLVIVALCVGAVAYGASQLPRSTPLTASVIEATDASATRVGVVIPLAAGMALQVGDTITVASPGHAILAIGNSQERLDGGAAVHLDRLDATGAGVSQLTGRAYARVGAVQQQSYQVVTGPVTWTATGTAFDIDREPVPSGPQAGQEKVTLLAIQDAVTATGPGFATPVPQGDRAVVYIGAASPIVAPTLDHIPASLLLDPWLQANGARDQQAGLPLGVLEGQLQTPQATAGPTPSPLLSSSPSPTDTAVPSSSATPTHAPQPTPVATPRRTPTPAPTPSPTPTIGSLGLSATACPGGVVLSWGKFNGGGFVRYVTLRAPQGDAIPAVYPPKLGYIAVVANTTSLSTADTAGQESDFTYRTLAIGSKNRVLAASGTPSAGGAGQPQSLVLNSPQSAGPNTVFSWTPFVASGACFTEYQVINKSTATVVWHGGSASTFGVTVTTPCANQTFELEVVSITALKTILTGQSAPVACGS